jgi:hypothetical protein
MIFELKQPTTALLASVANRSENHGEDKVPAVSLGLTIQASAGVLDMLCPELKPLLGVAGVESIALATVCEGWTMRIENGIDEDTDITLGGCRLDKFRVAPGNDGLVELHLRAGSHDLTPMTLGLIGMRVQQDVVVTITAPKIPMQTNSDTQARAMKKQREQETAGQQRIDTPEQALARAVGRSAS